jgi:hypothetical protein
LLAVQRTISTDHEEIVSFELSFERGFWRVI